MSKQGVMLASFFALLWGFWAPQSEAVAQQADLVAEKAAVEEVIARFVEAMKTRDLEQFSEVMAHDPDSMSFGTDAAEVWVGWEPVLEAVREQFTAFESVQVTTREQTVHVHDSGEAAWFANVSDWAIVSGGESVDLAGMRMTGVLEKRDGSWLIVQFHSSVPVAGQAVDY